MLVVCGYVPRKKRAERRRKAASMRAERENGKRRGPGEPWMKKWRAPGG